MSIKWQNKLCAHAHLAKKEMVTSEDCLFVCLFGGGCFSIVVYLFVLCFTYEQIKGVWGRGRLPLSSVIKLWTSTHEERKKGSANGKEGICKHLQCLHTLCGAWSIQILNESPDRVSFLSLSLSKSTNKFSLYLLYST